jgi:hypothetical protein
VLTSWYKAYTVVRAPLTSWHKAYTAVRAALTSWHKVCTEVQVGSASGRVPRQGLLLDMAVAAREICVRCWSSGWTLDDKRCHSFSNSRAFLRDPKSWVRST